MYTRVGHWIAELPIWKSLPLWIQICMYIVHIHTVSLCSWSAAIHMCLKISPPPPPPPQPLGVLRSLSIIVTTWDHLVNRFSSLSSLRKLFPLGHPSSYDTSPFRTPFQLGHLFLRHLFHRTSFPLGHNSPYENPSPKDTSPIRTPLFPLGHLPWGHHPP